MTSTTNYGLNIVEGTDVVNPLVQFNPNFTTIDGAMKANADASVSAATCVKVGTNHAITRSNTDASVFKFTATGNWETGDTMTVDSTPVTVFTPNGTSPLTGAYVINTDVIASINGTRVVIYTANTQASSIDAIDVVYDNSISGLTAVTAQGAIDELRVSSNILYDNTVSGLAATNVKSAIDEVVSKIPLTPAGAFTKVAESRANVTYDLQLQDLEPYFTAMTEAQKCASFIKYRNIIAKCDQIAYGRFSFACIHSSQGGIYSFNMSDSTYKSVGGSWTVNNLTSQTDPDKLELWTFM